jgi:hypothetical protein
MVTPPYRPTEALELRIWGVGSSNLSERASNFSILRKHRRSKEIFRTVFRTAVSGSD